MRRLLLLFLFQTLHSESNGFGIHPLPRTITGTSVTSGHSKRTWESLLPTSISGPTRLQAGMAQPETQIKTGVKTETKTRQKQAQKQQTKNAEPVSSRKEEFEEAPMFKLMLLGDDGADVEHVIRRLCSIVDDMDEDQAATVFEQAQLAGKAMCGKYPFERAELFKEQLLRSDPMIFADMEEENA